MGYESFKAYGEKELGYQENYIYKLVNAAEISLQIGFDPNCTIVQPPPETQLRPLKSVPEDDRKAIWEEATRKAERVIDVPAIVLAEHAENEIRKDFTVSERVEIGKAVEAELGKRQGQRTDLASEGHESLLGELVVNCPQVDPGQKTREVAAEKAGFGNSETYRQPATAELQAKRTREEHRIAEPISTN